MQEVVAGSSRLTGRWKRYQPCTTDWRETEACIRACLGAIPSSLGSTWSGYHRLQTGVFLTDSADRSRQVLPGTEAYDTLSNKHLRLRPAVFSRWPRPTSRGRCVPAYTSYLVDPASSHMLMSKIKPCMSKYKQICTVKLRMAH